MSSSAKAVPPPFNVSVTTDVTDTEHLANANIESTFNVDDDPWPAAYYQNQVSFTPNGWGVPASADIPIGAVVGTLAAEATLGWFNNPCNRDLGGYLPVDFDPLMNCSIDTSDTVTFEEQFLDDNGNGIPDGCDKYPDFLNEMFPGITPRTRHAGFEYIGVNVSLNFMTFEPGTTLPLPGMPSFSPDLGYPAMSILNDPTAPLVKNQITDNCPPLTTATVYYGVTENNPDTAADEAGYAWRTNPPYGGTYTFNGFASSIRDADDDGIDNALDTCPHIANEGDPRINWDGDDDNDGIDNACDPTPNTDTGFLDHDGDGFPNRQDNCPLVDNEDQDDADYDAIGDACDQDDWNGDGDTEDDPGEPTGFVVSVPDGDQAVEWFETNIEISGPAPPVPTAEDRDGDGVDDDVEEQYGSDPDDPLSTPEDAAFDEEFEAESCTDGEDNDLDGDIDADDEGCAAVEATPTPTPEGSPTPTPEVTPTPTPTVEVEICEPVFPGTYNGRVLIDGQPAASGYEVTASIDGMEWGSDIISGGRYAMDIPDHMPSGPPCFEGGTITFALDDMTCTPTADWASGIQTLDLECAPAAPAVTPTPTVTPTPAVTPTPTVTPVGPPPTGAGGLSGSGSGLPLWAMALATWAGLMTVAGLGTLVAAKRR